MKKVTSSFVLIAVLALCTSFMASKPAPEPASGMVTFLYEYMDLKYKDHQVGDVLYVATKRQRMYLIKDRKVVHRYKISSSKFGVGNEAGTQKTPLGLHTIDSKFGEEVPKAGILKQRQFTGRMAQIISEPVDVEQDDVTSRVLWLSGEEDGINKGEADIDSRKRCIYIHGTPEEGLIGKPASHGCIRMTNDDVIDLFPKVAVGTHVIILDN